MLPACLALLPGAARAQSDASPEIREQRSIMESIYHSKGRDTPPGYTIDRSLFSYIDTLHPEFGRSLATLGPDDRWLDIGAGQGRAILDYYTPAYASKDAEGRERPKASAVAISIEDRTTYRWRQ